MNTEGFKGDVKCMECDGDLKGIVNHYNQLEVELCSTCMREMDDEYDQGLSEGLAEGITEGYSNAVDAMEEELIEEIKKLDGVDTEKLCAIVDKIVTIVIEKGE